MHVHLQDKRDRFRQDLTNKGSSSFFQYKYHLSSYLQLAPYSVSESIFRHLRLTERRWRGKLNGPSDLLLLVNDTPSFAPTTNEAVHKVASLKIGSDNFNRRTKEMNTSDNISYLIITSTITLRTTSKK